MTVVGLLQNKRGKERERMMNECNVVVVIGQINGGIAGHFFQSSKPSILWACLPA
jgi:hypothetical protein